MPPDQRTASTGDACSGSAAGVAGGALGAALPPPKASPATDPPCIPETTSAAGASCSPAAGLCESLALEPLEPLEPLAQRQSQGALEASLPPANCGCNCFSQLYCFSQQLTKMVDWTGTGFVRVR